MDVYTHFQHTFMFKQIVKWILHQITTLNIIEDLIEDWRFIFKKLTFWEIILHMHLLPYDLFWLLLFWSLDSVVFHKMCYSASYL